jgi:hypothetical protein
MWIFLVLWIRNPIKSSIMISTTLCCTGTVNKFPAMVCL